MNNHSTKHGGFLRGLIFGLAIGLVCTAAAGSWAGMGKHSWEKRNWHFQVGYMAGFIDLMRILQARHPDTSLAREYTVPPQVRPHIWRDRVSALYEDEKHQGRPLTQIIVIAGHEFAAETGYVRTQGGQDGLDALRRYLTERNRKIAETNPAAEDADEAAGPDGGGAAAGTGTGGVE